jgi:hypothetical protein
MNGSNKKRPGSQLDILPEISACTSLPGANIKKLHGLGAVPLTAERECLAIFAAVRAT